MFFFPKFTGLKVFNGGAGIVFGGLLLPVDGGTVGGHPVGVGRLGNGVTAGNNYGCKSDAVKSFYTVMDVGLCW